MDWWWDPAVSTGENIRWVPSCCVMEWHFFHWPFPEFCWDESAEVMFVNCSNGRPTGEVFPPSFPSVSSSRPVWSQDLKQSFDTGSFHALIATVTILPFSAGNWPCLSFMLLTSWGKHNCQGKKQFISWRSAFFGWNSYSQAIRCSRLKGDGFSLWGPMVKLVRPVSFWQAQKVWLR